MDRETWQYAKGIGPEFRDALEISGERWKDFGFKSYRSIDFPDYDVCLAPLGERFDVIILEQVMEHVLWPYRAARNLMEMLRPGGVLILTTPFLIKIHEAPVDCSRWTEVGLKYLLAEGGFDLDRITTGSWGNRACVVSNFNQWTSYHPRLHSLKNEIDYPIHVWACAVK